MPDIYERITAFNKHRLPDIVKLKYKAMSANVFSFFRGTCHLFFEDMANTNSLPASPLTWICGDLHLENFGSFKGDNHMVYFDLNDFDEASLAPATWEITRMVTSILIAFDSLGLDANAATNAAKLFLSTYNETLSAGKARSIDPRTADGIVCTFLETAEKRKQKQLLKKGTVLKRGTRTLLLDERHFKLEKPLKKELIAFIDEWIKTSKYAAFNFETLDAVFRLAGTGSVGVKRYLFLLKSQEIKNKFLLLDMKQALPSSLQPYLKIKQPKWESEAVRVISIQERMQNVSPALLGAVLFNNEPYVLKQMQPVADKISFELLKDRYDDIDQVIKEMAILTASAQIRSTGRQNSAIADDLILYGKRNKWQSDILDYAAKYTKQVNKDYNEFITGDNKGLY